jgi:hypothetical protein
MKHTLTFWIVVLLAPLSAMSAADKSHSKPNIILILADDI